MEEKVIHNQFQFLLEDQRPPKLSPGLKPDDKKDDPILKYNYVIDRYNIEENQFNYTTLDFMPSSSIYNFIWGIINNSIKIILFLIALAIPGFGLILYLSLLMAFIHHSVCIKIWKKNIQKVPNPFENMVFCPELCTKMNKIDKFFEIQVKGIIFR